MTKSNSVDPNYAYRLRLHYTPLVQEFGYSFRSVDWGSETSQNKRFEILLDCVNYQKLRILDVGCGVGHLAAYLKSHNFTGSYLGIDLVPEMIEKARSYHRDFDFKSVDSPSEAKYFKPDLVVASGLFTFADFPHFKAIVSQLFDLTCHALAFNSLSDWNENQLRNEFHANPADVLIYCAGLTKKIVLRHDYMPHDLTMYLYR
jgi:trans-aconitate methyltransferase